MGLRSFELRLPDDASLQDVLERVEQAGLSSSAADGGTLVRDPFGNGVVLTV